MSASKPAANVRSWRISDIGGASDGRYGPKDAAQDRDRNAAQERAMTGNGGDGDEDIRVGMGLSTTGVRVAEGRRSTRERQMSAGANSDDAYSRPRHGAGRTTNKGMKLSKRAKPVAAIAARARNTCQV